MRDNSNAVDGLLADVQQIFGTRLQSVVRYGGMNPIHTLVVVEGLSPDDLRACAAKTASWHDAGLATPLLLAGHEFSRSLDTFPFEFGAILANHSVVAGRNPFEGLHVDPIDLRRACEVEARGHLLHLREAYLETRGRLDALAVLIVGSAPAFAGLVANVARIDGVAVENGAAAARHAERVLGISDSTASAIVALVGVHEIPSADAERLFGPYLGLAEKLVTYIDTWKTKDA